MSQSKKQLFADRFIPHRAQENFDISYYYLTNDNVDLDDIVPANRPKYTNYAHKLFTRQQYIDRLWKVFEPIPRKILNFNLKHSNTSIEELDQLWPAKPRKKPVIVSPSLILDMPELDTNLCHNIIDWGKREYIASVYNGEIFVWHEKKTKVLLTPSSDINVQFCLKWNCSGTKLALALENSELVVIAVFKNDILFRRTCCRKKICTITSFAWSKDDVLISGCSNGNLTSWFFLCGVGRSICKAHNGAIIETQLSCKEQYVASSGLDHVIRIWTWPEFDQLFEMTFHLPVKAFTWHPWREPLFVCSSGYRNEVISIWNVCSIKEVHCMVENYASIDAMTFNKKSGELVVSFYDSTSEKAFIAVFANFKEIRDAIIWHLGRVTYMLWNRDGTKLLTAGSDENLCIWNFFGDKKQSVGKKLPKNKKHSVNPLKNLNCFGQCLR